METVNIIINILSNGIGSRFGHFPKQYYMIKGKTVLDHTIDNITENLSELNHIKYEIYIVSNDKHEHYPTINGGKTRIGSILNAINYHKGSDYDLIFFHDAVRPLLSPDLFNEVYDLYSNKIKETPSFSIIPISKLVNSIIYKDGNTVDRDLLLNTHTPEIFTKDAIQCIVANDLHQIDTKLKTSLINISLELNIPYVFVQNPINNFKLTYKNDIIRYNLISSSQAFYSNDLIKLYDDPDYELSDKNVLVLGGTSGIGYSLVNRLNEHNNVHAFGSKDKIQNENFFSQLPNIKWDIIIHSIGNLKNMVKPIKHIKIDELNLSYKIHYESIIRLLHYIDSSQQNRKVKLIVLGSSSYNRGDKNMVAYSPLKAAISILGEIIAKEYPYINCNVVHPSRTDTKLRQIITKNEPKTLLLDSDVVAKFITDILKTSLNGKNILISKFDEMEYVYLLQNDE